jgi:hypothetical protein
MPDAKTETPRTVKYVRKRRQDASLPGRDNPSDRRTPEGTTTPMTRQLTKSKNKTKKSQDTSIHYGFC